MDLRKRKAEAKPKKEGKKAKTESPKKESPKKESSKQEKKSTKSEIVEGSEIPSFSVLDQDEKTVTSEELVKNHPKIVLYFYPKDNTPGCTTEAKEFRDAIEDFKKKGVSIVGVSKDTCNSHKKFIEKYQLNFTLLSDKQGELYKCFHVTSRSTFLIENGKFKKIYLGVKPKGHAAEVLKEWE